MTTELQIWHKYYARIYEILDQAKGKFEDLLKNALQNDANSRNVIVVSVIEKYRKYGGGLAFEQPQIGHLGALVSSDEKASQIPGVAKKEINSLKQICEEEVAAYKEVVLAQLDMKLREYDVSSRTTVSKEGADVYEKIDIEITGQDYREEKEAISRDIKARLVVMQDDAIVDFLLDRYGAFPNQTAIDEFRRYPTKLLLMDYLVALVAQRAVEERTKSIGEQKSIPEHTD